MSTNRHFFELSPGSFFGGHAILSCRPLVKIRDVTLSGQIFNRNDPITCWSFLLNAGVPNFANNQTYRLMCFALATPITHCWGSSEGLRGQNSRCNCFGTPSQVDCCWNLPIRNIEKLFIDPLSFVLKAVYNKSWFWSENKLFEHVFQILWFVSCISWSMHLRGWRWLFPARHMVTRLRGTFSWVRWGSVGNWGYLLHSDFVQFICLEELPLLGIPA